MTSARPKQRQARCGIRSLAAADLEAPPPSTCQKDHAEERLASNDATLSCGGTLTARHELKFSLDRAGPPMQREISRLGQLRCGASDLA